MKDTANTLLICESRNQVDWLANKPELIKNITHIVAANPDAIWALKKQGILHNTIEDYENNKTLEEMEYLLTEQISWAHKVDTFLQENILEFKETNFRPAEYYLYNIKTIWDTYIHRAEILDCIAITIKPTDIFFFPNEYPGLLDQELSPHSSTFIDCIQEWAQYYHINLHSFPILKKDNFWERQSNTVTQSNIVNKLHTIPPYQKIRYYSRRFPKFLKERSIYHYRNIIRKPFFRSQSKSCKTIIVQQGYDINDDLCGILENNGLFLLKFEENPHKNFHNLNQNLNVDNLNLQNAWDEIIKNNWFLKSNGCQKYFLKNPLKNLFNQFWFKIIPALFQSTNDSLTAITQIKPNAVIVPIIFGVKAVAQIMAAKNQNVPVIVYQHGTIVGDPIIDITDRFYSDFSFVYGDGEADLFQKRPKYGIINNVAIPVGSTRLDNIRNQYSKNDAQFVRYQVVGNSEAPIFLYVPGIIHNNISRYTPHINNCEIFKIREKIAHIFNSFKNVHFCYKSFVSVGYDPTSEMISSICPHCKIISDISLTDLQQVADVIIHEKAPCTGLYENLLTDKVIIAYSQDFSNLPENIKIQLTNRISITDDKDEFLKKIECVLDSSDISPIVNPDDTFLKSYCTYLNDGKSAERAANAIMKIIKGDQFKKE